MLSKNKKEFFLRLFIVASSIFLSSLFLVPILGLNDLLARFISQLCLTLLIEFLLNFLRKK